ncbi:MAG TPA: hypothetical protein VFX15_12075 [Actinomycetes bacterium]|nr:hypothetical protein [Actinomycetes bacterium]
MAVGVSLAGVALLATPASGVELKPDRDFAGDGRQVLNVPGYQFSTDVVVDGSTSYLIGNTPRHHSRREYRIVVAKYGPKGGLDRSFANRGRKFVSLGPDTRAFSGSLTPDGGILLAGWTVGSHHGAFIVKLRPNGAVDRTFSRDGVVYVSSNRGISWPLVEAEPDGDIWLAWASVKGYDYERFDSDFRVMHFTPRGAVDRAFSGDGVRVFDVGKSDYTYFTAVDSSGRFFLTGMSTNGDKAVDRTAILSVPESGQASVRTLSPWDRKGSFPLTLDVDESDKVVVGLTPSRKLGWGAARMTTDLKLDDTYGNGGVARHDCSCTSSSGALTDDGLFLVGNGGKTQQETVVAHFTTSGLWDAELGNSRYNLSRDWEYWVETEVDSAQRLVLAGTAKGDDGDMAIARLKAAV